MRVTDIIFQATVSKVQTLADGGLRVTLDMAESETVAMMQLVECKRFEAVLHIIARPAKQETTGNEQQAGNVAGRSEWQPQR